MKSWSLSYRLSLQLQPSASFHHFSLRCIPGDTKCQRILSRSCILSPAANTAWSVDSFGNQLLIGKSLTPHDRLTVSVTCRADCEDADLPEEKSQVQLGYYRMNTALTAPGSAIRKLAQSLPKDTDAWNQAQIIMDGIAAHFRYVSGSTNMFTCAEEALMQGTGVCQDYAHIMVSICRWFGLTARYAVGAIPGEGQTHAWVQVWQDGFWRGFDPTHCCRTDDNYILFSVGRDAGDCSLSRGIFRGSSLQTQQVSVKMEEIQ